MVPFLCFQASIIEITPFNKHSELVNILYNERLIMTIIYRYRHSTLLIVGLNSLLLRFGLSPETNCLSTIWVLKTI